MEENNHGSYILRILFNIMFIIFQKYLSIFNIKKYTEIKNRKIIFSKFA